MATIYQKTVSDKTIILAPREGILRQFDFQNWTEMRFGLFFGGVTSGGDNTDATGESVSVVTAQDKICVGLKNADTNDTPGSVGSLFLGVMTGTGLVSLLNAAGPSRMGTDGTSYNLSAGGYAGTTLLAGTTSEYVGPLISPVASSAATGYNGFYAMKFVITNLGLSSQTVTVTSGSTGSIAGTDYSAQALRLLINNATYGGGGTFAWNTGAAARAIPNAIWVRMPFYSNRIRISAMRAIRYAP